MTDRFFCLRLNMHTPSERRPASLWKIVAVSLYALTAAPAHGETSLPAPTSDETSLRLVISNSLIEASKRFHIPVRWLRAVMRAESAGDVGAVSKKGAIGLMQIMPVTYAELQTRYSLGPNPFNLHDNIHAGAAYLSEMLERYGERGFLAAYNAGPKRYEDYLRGRPLPAETTDYVAQLSSEHHLNESPTRYVALPPDAAHSQIFVACKASNDWVYRSSTNSVEDIPRAETVVRRPPLVSAQRDAGIFATGRHDSRSGYASALAVLLRPGDLFVARQVPQASR